MQPSQLALAGPSWGLLSYLQFAVPVKTSQRTRFEVDDTLSNEEHKKVGLS